MARYISLYSGSSGNCSVVEENGKFILIDMGKSARLTNKALTELGLDIKNLQGILVSHEHTDHTAGLKVFLKNLRVPVYTGVATADFLTYNDLIPAHIDIQDADYTGFNIGDFYVKGFETPHDSLCCMGYRITTGKGHKMSIATDLGFVTEDIFHNLKDVSLAVVESNYDVQMLKEGPYPYYLKSRIASNRGHLSNDQSAQTTLRLIESGVNKIQLCHLSNNNNTPTLALERVQKTAVANGIVIGNDVQVKVNRHHEITADTEF